MKKLPPTLIDQFQRRVRILLRTVNRSDLVEPRIGDGHHDLPWLDGAVLRRNRFGVLEAVLSLLLTNTTYFFTISI